MCFSGMQPPDGPPVCTALHFLPSGIPPPISLTTSRSVIPMGTSISPVLVTRPARANTLVPLLFSVPIPANQAAPLRTMGATLANVSTLLMRVGLSHRPDSAGYGGRGRGVPRFPSMEAIRAVSSPHPNAPAPPQAPGLPDGGLQGIPRQRGFGANVEKALLGAHGVGRDGHAFQHAMRVAFEHRAIHERAGIALVGVADDVFFLLAGLGHGAPFEARGIARAAPPAEAAADDLLNRFLRAPPGDGVYQREVAVVGDVVFDALGIDLAAVLQYDLLLALEEGHVRGTFLRPPGAGVEAGHDFGGLFRRDVGEHLAVALHRNQRAGAAKPHAAHALHEHFVLHARFDDFLPDGVEHVGGAGGETAGGGADAHAVLVFLFGLALGFGDFSKVLNGHGGCLSRCVPAVVRGRPCPAPRHPSPPPARDRRTPDSGPSARKARYREWFRRA